MSGSSYGLSHPKTSYGVRYKTFYGIRSLGAASVKMNELLRPKTREEHFTDALLEFGRHVIEVANESPEGRFDHRMVP
jgi:hypothetical protein